MFEDAHVEVPGKLARVDSLLPDGPRNVTGLGGSAPLSHFTGLQLPLFEHFCYLRDCAESSEREALQSKPRGLHCIGQESNRKSYISDSLFSQGRKKMAASEALTVSPNTET